MQLQFFLLGFYGIFSLWCNFFTVEAIIGDSVRSAEEFEFPFIVAIIKYVSQNNMQRNYKCAGTLISRNDVLTSEHCLACDALTTINVLVGSAYLNNAIRYYPEWWISYDQWAVCNNHEIEFTDNDIAILNLIERVPNSIEPARIFNTPMQTLYGLGVHTAGWGLINNNVIPNTLRIASVNILSKENCEHITQRFFTSPIRVDARTICTSSAPYTLLRSGDSGGPLFFLNQIIGINIGTVPVSIENFNFEGVNVHLHISHYYHFVSDLQDYY